MSFEEEREAIASVLEFTGKLLEHLMSGLNPEDRTRFQDAWAYETRPQLDEAIRMLRGQPRDEDTRVRAFGLYEARGREEGHDAEDWERAQRELGEDLRRENGPLHSFLRRVGLVGKSLKMKLTYVADAATKGWRMKLLNLLNKFLGSLAAGIPGTEAVKEIKEWLEDMVENLSEPDQNVTNIYFRSGNDPFYLKKL